jgi:predicted phosphodiesterase
LAQICGRPVDIVVLGYANRAMVEVNDGALLMNPGSPSL